jgi:hypothetical protein
MRRISLAASLAVVAAIAVPGVAQARKPVIAYVDSTTNKLVLYDAETAAALPAPSVTVPGPVRRFSVSFGGRYVVWADAALKLHLLDRATDTERSLPGIDVYTAGTDKPAGLTVSDTGLIAFDNNSNGPAVVYDSAAAKFVATGLSPANGHRQSHLSADGSLLATTCVTGAAKCAVEDGGDDSDVFVQNLATKADTALPDLTAMKDDEHPCISGDGRIVGADSGAADKDVHLYDRVANTAVTPSGLNSPTAMQVNCVLSPGTGQFVGLDDNAGHFKMFDRTLLAYVPLPATIAPPAWFTSAYSPPAPPTPPAPPGGSGPPPAPPLDTVAPDISATSLTNRRFAVDRKGAAEPLVTARARKGTTFAYTLSEPARVLFRVEKKTAGRRSGGKCVKRSRRVRRGRACTLWVPKGAFAQDGAAGANTKPFSGKLGKRRLTPGSYRATLTATDAAGNASKARRLAFRVVAR